MFLKHMLYSNDNKQCSINYFCCFSLELLMYQNYFYAYLWHLMINENLQKKKIEKKKRKKEDFASVEKSIKTMSFSEEKPRNCLYRKDKCRLMQRAQGPLLPALLPKWAPPEVQYLCKCPSCFIPVW